MMSQIFLFPLDDGSNSSATLWNNDGDLWDAAAYTWN